MTARPGQIQSNPIDDLCDATAALKVLSTLMTNRPDEVILRQDELHGLNVLFRAASDRLDRAYETLIHEKTTAWRAAQASPPSDRSTKLEQKFRDLIGEFATQSAEEAPVYPIIDMPAAEEAGRVAVG